MLAPAFGGVLLKAILEKIPADYVGAVLEKSGGGQPISHKTCPHPRKNEGDD